MASSLIKRVPILDDPPEKRRVAVTERLPNLSNYLATDVSAWAAEMIIVRDNGLWQEAGAASWEDYCTNVVKKPLDWCSWIIGGYEALRAGRENRPVSEVEALAAGREAEAKAARQNPIMEGEALRVLREEGGKLGGHKGAEFGKLGGRGNKNPLSDNIRKGVTNEGGTGKGYLLRRLAAQAPDILNAYERGDHRSVRAAAIAAGIVKKPSDFDKLTKLWNRLDADTQSRFLTWAANSKRDEQ